MLEAEAAEHETELELLVTAACPQLLDRPGIGVITAAQFLISWSHRDRVRSEAAFAALAGAAPIPASSGATVRHRLNRAGDRQLNRALHTVALTRLRFEPTTKAYAARRTADGKTPREIKRCLKRAIAREVYRIMQTHAASVTSAERRLDRHRSILVLGQQSDSFFIRCQLIDEGHPGSRSPLVAVSTAYPLTRPIMAMIGVMPIPRATKRYLVADASAKWLRGPLISRVEPT